jgi:hypothetical protein
MMDPIERIANRLVADCTKSLECLCEIERIIDSSETIVAALEQLRQRDFKRFVDEEHLDWIPYDIGRYRRCIEAIGDIKRMARKVFAVNFFDADVYYVFNQEISFSYACKMLSQVGPLLPHFSNHPTATEVMSAEIRLACNTRFFELEDESSDLLCLESMPTDVLLQKRAPQPNSTTTFM